VVTITERPLRADAERNRLRILDAAQRVFAVRGLQASLDDVAREAGVGVGTVYRRFADKDELVEALFSSRIDAVVCGAHVAAESPEAWAGLVRFLEERLCEQVSDRGLTEVLLSSQRGRQSVIKHKARLVAAVEGLVARCHAAGVLRPGIAATDLACLQVMLGAVHDRVPAEPEVWRRYLSLFLDGLRADDGGRVPLTTPAPLPGQLLGGAACR